MENENSNNAPDTPDTPDTLIIGITGQKSSGKSTLQKLIIKQHFKDIVSVVQADFNIKHEIQLPFAKTLKSALFAMGVPMRNLTGTPEEKEEPLEILGGKSARYAMQTLGTEWGRNLIQPNLWVDIWKQRVTEAQQSKSCKLIIADDVRFLNEAKAVHDVGGFLIKIIDTNTNSRDATSTDNHASETEQKLLTQDQIDFTVENNIRDDNLEDLNQQVKKIIEAIEKQEQRARNAAE